MGAQPREMEQGGPASGHAVKPAVMKQQSEWIFNRCTGFNLCFCFLDTPWSTPL